MSPSFGLLVWLSMCGCVLFVSGRMCGFVSGSTSILFLSLLSSLSPSFVPSLPPLSFSFFSACLHICLYICQSVSIYIHVCLSIYLTVFHPSTQSLYHSIYLSLHPSIYLYISSLKPLQVKENPHFYKNPDVGVYSSKTPSQYSYTALSASECKEGGREGGGVTRPPCTLRRIR